MTDVLMLGGTGWLSERVTRRWLDAGAAVTCLARGSSPAPEGAHLIRADRAAPDALESVAGRAWDEVVDVSSVASHVQAAVTALGDNAGHWTFLSSVSVYADNDVAGADESAPLAAPAEPDDTYDYARAKAAAERAVGTLGSRAAIVRPGLIVGPGDPTGRFGYWPARFTHAAKRPVLVPASDGLTAQVIDVDDLADFVVTVGTAGWTGAVNAVGPSMPLKDVLAAARLIAGHTGDLVEASESWLRDQNVTYWAGPRSLPLWLPGDMPGFATRAGTAYRAAGGDTRPFDDTLRRVLVDERSRGVDRERPAGLIRADELDLIALLR